MNKIDSAVNHHVFNISDGTTITTEVLGHAVMSQFPVTISSVTLPFVGNENYVRAVKDQIDVIYQQTGMRPLVFCSTIPPRIRSITLQSEGFCQDIVQALVAPPQYEIRPDSTPITHRTHGLNPGNLDRYDTRIAAIDCTLAHDDGISLCNLGQVQVILLGVSRCGKIPISSCLTMQFSIRAVNYPFIAGDMDNLVLPTSLRLLQHELFGLTIEPERLAATREERRENSHYASLRQCRMEVAEVEALYWGDQIPWLNGASYSVEGITTKTPDIVGSNRRMHQNASVLVRFFVIMLTIRQDECDVVMYIISRQPCR